MIMIMIRKRNKNLIYIYLIRYIFPVDDYVLKEELGIQNDKKTN